MLSFALPLASNRGELQISQITDVSSGPHTFALHSVQPCSITNFVPACDNKFIMILVHTHTGAHARAHTHTLFKQLNQTIECKFLSVFLTDFGSLYPLRI